jgi:predicted transglutaminase-like cysteine proteinase
MRFLITIRSDLSSLALKLARDSKAARSISRRSAAITIAFAVLGLAPMAAPHAKAAETGSAMPVYAPVGDITTSPSGYQQFCRDNPDDCRAGPQEARDIVLSRQAWKDLVALNDQVNHAVKPMTDLDNYGKVEWWAYPTDGYGDCEDYVLLKRKLLIDAGWPRSALLITVVRDKKGEGHAVLMVKTDRGEFVLDNQEQKILSWRATGYRYVKRQSQSDQNVWVSLGDTQTTAIVSSKGY